MKRYINLLLIFFLLCTITSFSAVPEIMNYQGLVTDRENKAYNGVFLMTFSLFNEEYSNHAIWEETQQVAVTNGYFNVYLGVINPLKLPFDTQYWLGIKIGNKGEFIPKVKLATTPYSYSSAVTDSIRPNRVVSSINSMKDNVNLLAGENISIKNEDNNIIISAKNVVKTNNISPTITPIALGNVNSDGTLTSATANVQCKFIGGSYEITLEGENYNTESYITVVQPNLIMDNIPNSTNHFDGWSLPNTSDINYLNMSKNPYHFRVSSASGKLKITWLYKNYDMNKGWSEPIYWQIPFNFVVYKI